MIAVVTLVAAGILNGCLGCGTSNSYAYIGKWVGHRNRTPQPNMDPQAVEEAYRITLTVQSGGHFTLIDAGMPKEGDFHLDGDHLVLNITSILGRPMERQPEDVQKMNVPILVTPIDKKSVRFYDPTGLDKDGVVLERNDSPDPKP